MANTEYWRQVHSIAKAKDVSISRARGLWRGIYAPSRSLAMKQHWRKAHIISKRYGIPIQEARRVTTAVKQGARIMEHADTAYIYEVVFVTDDEEIPKHYASITSDVLLNQTEIKNEARDLWDKNMGRYENVQLVEIKVGERGVSPYLFRGGERKKIRMRLEEGIAEDKARMLAKQKKLGKL